jgi:hypothetical protein
MHGNKQNSDCHRHKKRKQKPKRNFLIMESIIDDVKSPVRGAEWSPSSFDGASEGWRGTPPALEIEREFL